MPKRRSFYPPFFYTTSRSAPLIVCAVLCFYASALFCEAPYMVSLRASKANVRTGPGKIYPALWVLMRTHIPLKVIETFDVWRKIQDPLGTEGWVHKSLLSSEKTVFITRKTLLYTRPSFKGRPKVYLGQGVSAKLISITPSWFYVSIKGYKGYVARRDCWEGSLPVL